MKKVLSSFTILSLILIPTYFLIVSSQSERDHYEQFLLQQASKISLLDEADNMETVSPDQPDMAAFQEYVKTLDPELGYVPTKRLLSAYKYTTSIEQKQQTARDYEPTLGWEETGANMGGRTRTIMFDPNDVDHQKVWAGGVTGGLWYTKDITEVDSLWMPVGDFWSNLAISCMAFDPNNTQTFYVGTGEAQTARVIYRKSSGLGAGIFKTDDGGDSWT